MAENKTRQTEASVPRYLAAIEDEGLRKDCKALAKLMSKAAKAPAKMWGPSIVGFGSYHYVYDSGREGDFLLIGFAARKNTIALYGLKAAVDADALLAKLGKHKAAGACIHVKSLDDLDLKVLEKLAASAAKATQKMHAPGKDA
jgi:hypothetical protein